jgi:DnaJ-class molecular chaperone
MTKAEAVMLFRRLGIDALALAVREFNTAYFALAKRYHPDHNPRGAELMAAINAARDTLNKDRGF